MIRIALVEDEAEVRAQLQGYVQRHTRQYGTEFAVTEFADGMELLDDYRPVYDILFLDVEMKHLDGMETARRVRDAGQGRHHRFLSRIWHSMPSAGTRWARWTMCSSRCLILHFRSSCARPKNSCAAAHGIIWPCRWRAECGGWIRPSSIIWKARGHRVHFYTEEGDFVAAGTLKAFEEKLAERPFARCNSGYLVNLAQVKSVQQGMVQVGPYELQVSRPGGKPSSRRWPTTSGVRVHDGIAQHPAPVYGAG